MPTQAVTTRVDGPSNGDWQIIDEVWMRIASLLPKSQYRPQGGRPRIPDRQAMQAIFYVLSTGCAWKALPRSFGAASTIHDRFREWHRSGLLQQMEQEGLLRFELRMKFQSNSKLEWHTGDGRGKEPSSC
jgi:putative transposase